MRDAFILLCASWCAARAYAGGFPTKDHKACNCFERVELDTPAALTPVTASWASDLPKEQAHSIVIENSRLRPIYDWRDAGLNQEKEPDGD